MTRDRKLELNIGRVKDLLDKGHSVAKICAALGMNESTVRSYKEVIEKAELNKSKEMGS